jgi:hypothetical protein
VSRRLRKPPVRKSRLKEVTALIRREMIQQQEMVTQTLVEDQVKRQRKKQSLRPKFLEKNGVTLPQTSTLR